MRKIIITTLALATLANASAIAATRKDPAALSASRAVTAERMRTCGAEWKTAKIDAAVKTAGWPHFWSTCNAKLKASGQVAQPAAPQAD